MVDLEFDDKNYFTFYAAAEYNGKLYISDPDNRGLLVYDLDTKEINVKNIFMAKTREIIIGRLFLIMVKYGLFR